MTADVGTEVTPGTESTDGLGAGGRASADTVEDAIALADELVDAWGSWGPNMTPDARQVAFIKFVGTHAEYDKIDALTVNLF